MYQALYRKYRPMTFDDVCGQDHITSVLKTQIALGRTTHAYMFCGCRGTGKTTCAKIFARAVNCENLQNGEPCNECPTCRGIREERIFDVVEMDAASNNSVDNVRTLTDEVQYLPTEAKKKVYIIDEVHMLSPSAFNALLKTIEEPPEHVIFLFATTEVNKVPATIMSRCQRFDFKRITPEIIQDRVMKVATQENIPIDRDAAAVIARLSDGAMRDAMSLLEVCQGQKGKIGRDEIRCLLGLGSREVVINLCRAVTRFDAAKALSILREIYENRSDLRQIIGDMIRTFRDLIVIRSVPSYQEFVDADGDELASLSEMALSLPLETLLYQSHLLEDFYASYDRAFSDKRAGGEVLMIRLCQKECSVSPEAISSRLALLEKAVLSGNVPAPAPIPETSEAPNQSPMRQERPAPSSGTVLFEEKAKLKASLQIEKSIKYLVKDVLFLRENDTLRVQATPTICGMLAAAGANEIILKHAKQITPGIRAVVIEEMKEIEQLNNDLDEL